MAAARKLVTLLALAAWATVAAPYYLKITAVDGALTCGQVVASLLPCIDYLENGGDVSAPCCKGVRSLNSVAKTNGDRRKACDCMKSAAIGYPGMKEPLAAALPNACGVDIPYKISRNFDCKSIR